MNRYRASLIYRKISASHVDYHRYLLFVQHPRYRDGLVMRAEQESFTSIGAGRLGLCALRNNCGEPVVEHTGRADVTEGHLRVLGSPPLRRKSSMCIYTCRHTIHDKPGTQTCSWRCESDRSAIIKVNIDDIPPLKRAIRRVSRKVKLPVPAFYVLFRMQIPMSTFSATASKRSGPEATHLFGRAVPKT